jgi:hypothetical protein
MTYTTAEQVWQAAGDAYRGWRSAGHSEDSAAADAASFYAYQMQALKERQPGFRFGPLPGPVQDVDGFFEEGARIVERNLAERQAVTA